MVGGYLVEDANPVRTVWKISILRLSIRVSRAGNAILRSENLY